MFKEITIIIIGVFFLTVRSFFIINIYNQNPKTLNVFYRKKSLLFCFNPYILYLLKQLAFCVIM